MLLSVHGKEKTHKRWKREYVNQNGCTPSIGTLMRNSIKIMERVRVEAKAFNIE
jgi:hypothetical protein